MNDKEKALDEREALIEMYKAGFLDAYKLNNKLNKKVEWDLMNKFYMQSFINRFEKPLNKVFKKQK